MLVLREESIAEPSNYILLSRWPGSRMAHRGKSFKLTPFNRSKSHMKRKQASSLKHVSAAQPVVVDLRQAGLHFFSRTAYEDPKSPSFVQINSLRHQWRVGLLECQVPRFYLHFSTSESYGNWSWVFVFPPRFCENKFHVQIVSWPPFPSQARTVMCTCLRYRYSLLQPCVQSHDWVQTQNTFSSWNSAAFWQVNHFWWVRGHGNSGALRVLPVESSHVNGEGIIAQRVK